MKTAKNLSLKPSGVSVAGGIVVWAGYCAWAMAAAAESSAWQQRLEQDWLVTERIKLQDTASNTVSTAADAIGGCDGVKNGEWGFHTGSDAEPWWQVDLGRSQALGRVVIWNRTAGAERAARIRVLLSDGGQEFTEVYKHDGTVFFGVQDDHPLAVDLKGTSGRYVRLRLPGNGYFHLDEVEVFGTAEPLKNLALRGVADQSSTSAWSTAHTIPMEVNWREAARAALANAEKLLAEVSLPAEAIRERQDRLNRLTGQLTEARDNSARELFLQARRVQRELALRNPLLKEFDALLFTKRVPGSFNHMSDQYYGWWSKPGGGIYLLKDFATDSPKEQCLSASFKEPGSFLRPMLSYDGSKVLFAWCRHYPGLAAETNKLNKANVPEDAFYHLFEMNIDGSGARQITRGKYDDFDGRYLPDGRIVFLSTRRGQALQAGRESAQKTILQPDLPDSYVRCGGGPERPVAVYTLHTMKADGTDLCAISPFEMFEWTPDIGQDGSIIYSRWDYIDRDNMPYMGLWAMNPDGSNVRLIYKNYTKAPHCTFEAKPVPNSRKLVFTASAHHAQTMGSLVLLDPGAGTEGSSPITRLTPEVPFPEIEGWPLSSYANPWPLSERFHLVAWGCEGAQTPGPAGWSRWHAVQRPPNGMGLFVYDALTRSRELLFADPSISCGDPIPVRRRECPPVIASQLAATSPREGMFFLADVYRGLTNVGRGEIRSLRLVAIPAKTHPTMNFPSLGLTRDDPGKCVLGTVPVAADGSACFRVPSGVILFFQALNARGVAVQTMRSATQVQPGETMSCIGCHEHRGETPPARGMHAPLALAGAPAKITPGPEGSWPLRFDRLVEPVLQARCVSCHSPGGASPAAAKFDLTPAKAYDTLVSYGTPSLRDQVMDGYRRGFSLAGQGIAERSLLLAHLENPPAKCGAVLDAASRERLVTWLDTYAQRLGHFSPEQEEELTNLRQACHGLLAERDVVSGRGGQ